MHPIEKVRILNKQFGFTLVEVLISVAILSILLSIGLLSVSRMSQQLFVGSSDVYLLNIFSTASRQARDGIEGSSWGVYLPYDEETRNLSEIIIFKGNSYAARDSAFDKVFNFSEGTDFVSVDFSGAGSQTQNSHEVVFDVYSGQTSQYGTVLLEVFGVERSVSISEHGFITREL